MRISRKFPLLLLVLLLFSCSFFRSRLEPYPAGVLFPLTEAGKEAFEGDINGALVQGEDGRLYFSTDKGHLYCLEGIPPKIAWHVANAAPYGCAPHLALDRVFVWDLENVVFCFDRAGQAGWKTRLADTLSSPISHDRERLLVGTESGDLLALSQATGKELWRFRTGATVSAAAAFYMDTIILGSRDGWIYLVGPDGTRRSAFDLGSPVSVTPLVDGRNLYVGTEDFGFACYDLLKRKFRWKIRAAGRILAPPCVDEKRVYLQASNSVLYALNKSGGEILWWRMTPSRSPFRLEFDGEKVLVASRSPVFFALDKKTGKDAGKFEAGAEIRSNPVWAEPYLLFAVYDPSAGQGVVSWLEKDIKVEIAASPSSPQAPGSEVVFTVSASGFYRPDFEFTLRQGEETSVVQAASDQKSWVWYPEKAGSYTIGVKVRDEKHSKEAEMPFEIAVKDKKAEVKKDEKGDR